MHTIGRDFVLAGKATFTLRGRDSRFTYRVSRKDPEPGSRYTQPTYFVGLLTGPDNVNDYSYMGILDPATGHVRLTRNSRTTLDAPSYKAINWALPKVFAGAAMPPSFSIYHEGACGRCGRVLTVPESIVTGIGPECAAKMGLAQAVLPSNPRPKAARKSRRSAPPAGDPARTLLAGDFQVGPDAERPSLTALAAAVKPFDMEAFLTNELR